jgi:hypothetical protein
MNRRPSPPLHPRGNELALKGCAHVEISGWPIKAEMPNVKKQPPRPEVPKTGPVGLGEGLESPRSPHC